MLGWLQIPLYLLLCSGLALVTLFIVMATIRGCQLQWIEIRFRRQFATKQYDEALNTLDQALKLNPTNPIYYHQRAKIHAELDDFLSAEEDYTHGMRFAQGATAYAGRASVRLALGRYKESLIDANHAIACSRLWWRGYYERGRAYAALGHYAIALEDFNQTLELNRVPPPEVYLARAEAATHLGDTETAGRDRLRAEELLRR